MKEIVAIVRMEKVGATRSALADAGFCRMTAVKVKGRGKLLKDLALVDKVPDENRDLLLESMLKGGRLIPKRMITIAAQDEDVPKIIETIISVNQQGHVGDGKIFVLPLQDVVRVRTAENGSAAI